MADRLMVFMLNAFMYVKLATSEDNTYTVYSDTPVLECAAFCVAEASCESFDVDDAAHTCYLAVRGVRDSNILELPEATYYHRLKTDLENDTSGCFRVGRLHNIRHTQRTADVKKNTTEKRRNLRIRPGLRVGRLHNIRHTQRTADVKKNTTEKRRNLRIRPAATAKSPQAYRDVKASAAKQDSDDEIQACSIRPTTMSMGTTQSMDEGLQNVALKKRALQSSNYSSTMGAFNAVDGRRQNTILQIPNERESCTHTVVRYTTSVWWWVDLGSAYNIVSISIVNREGSLWKRLSNFTISIGDHLTADFEVNYTSRCLQVEPFRDIQTFTCGRPCRGRYVMIKMTNTSNPLTLCEVEVYAVMP